jgi:hypothetical protein
MQRTRGPDKKSPRLRVLSGGSFCAPGRLDLAASVTGRTHSFHLVSISLEVMCSTKMLFQSQQSRGVETDCFAFISIHAVLLDGTLSGRIGSP